MKLRYQQRNYLFGNTRRKTQDRESLRNFAMSLVGTLLKKRLYSLLNSPHADLQYLHSSSQTTSGASPLEGAAPFDSAAGSWK
jgi:hypothetical protein